MSWFVGSLIVLWYAVAGHAGGVPQRERPWYKNKETPTMADMLAACRYQMWESWINEATTKGAPAAGREEKLAWLLKYIATSSGPLLDRIDLHIEVPSVPYQELAAKQGPRRVSKHDAFAEGWVVETIEPSDRKSV